MIILMLLGIGLLFVSGYFLGFSHGTKYCANELMGVVRVTQKIIKNK